MAIQTTEGIILRKRDLRETSVILTLLTKDFGKICGVMRGARGPKAAIGLNPQIFSLNSIVFYERRRGNLNNISECDLKDFFSPIRDDFERTIYADYLIELADMVTVEGDADRKIYDLLLSSLSLLTKPVSAKRVARIFEIKLMDIAGFMPDLNGCAKCGKAIEGEARFDMREGALFCAKCLGHSGPWIKISGGTINFITHVRKMPFDLLSRVKVSGPVGRELEDFLRRFVDFHIERPLKTVEFIKKVNMT
ncbi:MAG: DNA repair protein RecO [Candidatus Omnitrophota bacterium]